MCQTMYQGPFSVEHILGIWFPSVALTKRACLRSQFMVLKATPTEQLSWDPMSPTYLQTHTLYIFQAV